MLTEHIILYLLIGLIFELAIHNAHVKNSDWLILAALVWPVVALALMIYAGWLCIKKGA